MKNGSKNDRGRHWGLFILAPMAVYVLANQRGELDFFGILTSFHMLFFGPIALLFFLHIRELLKNFDLSAIQFVRLMAFLVVFILGAVVLWLREPWILVFHVFFTVLILAGGFIVARYL